MDSLAARVLGHVTVPCGTLVVGDMGYLYMWSGLELPRVADRGEERRVLDAMTNARDLAFVGVDAEKAARTLNLQSLTYLYDIPAHGVEALQTKLAQATAANHLYARIEETARVPHRERARRAAEVGGSDFLIFGVSFIAVGGIPRRRPLPVIGNLYDMGGPTGPRWANVELRASDQPVTETKQIGFVGVDMARLIFADADALGSWLHDEPIDGLADVVFWGRDAASAAEELGAPATDDGYGWVNLEVREAIAQAERVDKWRLAGNRRLNIDLRPHSHHFEVMSQVRATENQVGKLAVGGADMVGLMTSWGDGVFPVEVDRAVDGSLVAVRVQLGDDERAARIAAL